QWTLQRLAVMPITRAQLLGGKILTYFTLGMIQYLIIFAVGVAVGLDLGDDWIGLLLVMIAFVLCITALAFALAIYMQNEEQAAGTARLLALTLAPLGGAWWPLEIVPGFMQAIAKASPIAWAMQGFKEIIFYGGSVLSILPEVGILIAAAALLFGVAIWQFRVE
ncbi:MAG: ABC transporter permease, partial [Caldilineaceae bacterium]|nr:ABC transporter permease [Caldilineaceae bacterium]